MKFSVYDFPIIDRLLRDQTPGSRLSVEEIIETVVREANYKLEQVKLRERLKKEKAK